jgi:thiamine kinase-like enzyme
MGTPEAFDELCRTALTRGKLASPEINSLLRDHAQQIREAMNQLVTTPMGAVHGQLYPVNVLIEEDSGSVVIVDWETLGYGPALFDLAALLFGCPWTTGGRERIIASYFSSYIAGTDLETSSARRKNWRTTLRQTELFHQLWILMTVPADYWHPARKSGKGETRREASLLMLEQCLEALA